MRMKIILIFGDKAAISLFTTKIWAFTSADKCHNFTNVTACQSLPLQQDDVKKIFLPIDKVRFSHLPTDLEGSEFEMCWFEMSWMKKMNLENMNATSKFVSTFPLQLLRVGEKYSAIMLFKHW